MLLPLIEAALPFAVGFTAAGLPLIGAPRDFYMSSLDEGTAKIILRGSPGRGAVSRILFQWSGYKMDENGIVTPFGHQFNKETLLFDYWGREKEKEDREKHPRRWYGGYRRGPLYPFETIWTRNMRWPGLILDKEKNQLVPHVYEEILSHVWLRPDVYKLTVPYFSIDRFPVTVKFAFTIRFHDPETFAIRAPSNPIENMVARLMAIGREWMGTRTPREMIAFKKEVKDKRDEFERLDLIGEFNTFLRERQRERKEPITVESLLNAWGMFLMPEGAQVLDVNFDEKYEKVIAAEKEREYIARGMTKETVGLMIHMLAEVTGQRPEEIRGEIKKSPERQKQFQDMLLDLVRLQTTLDRNAYVLIRTEGQGAGFDPRALIGLWQKMPKGVSEIEKGGSVK